MLNKEKVLSTISNLPSSFTLDELVDKMILLDKIEKGLKDSEEDNVLTEDELEKRIAEWSK